MKYVEKTNEWFDITNYKMFRKYGKIYQESIRFKADNRIHKAHQTYSPGQGEEDFGKVIIPQELTQVRKKFMEC